MGSQFCAYLRTVPLSTYKTPARSILAQQPKRSTSIWLHNFNLCLALFANACIANILYTLRVLGHVPAHLPTTLFNQHRKRLHTCSLILHPSLFYVPSHTCQHFLITFESRTSITSVCILARFLSYNPFLPSAFAYLLALENFNLHIGSFYFTYFIFHICSRILASILFPSNFSDKVHTIYLNHTGTGWYLGNDTESQ